MIYPKYFNPKNSLNLYGLSDDFDILKKLYVNHKLPKVLMLSGKKGSGKSTLVNHLMYYIYDKKNYDDNIKRLLKKSTFYNQFINSIYSNIIFLNGSEFKNVKIDDIRNLKTKILQSSISDLPRFIIFDDVELFNTSSLNALLKIIEEPGKKNYFILINNKSRPLLDTIKSRCLEIKVTLNESKRLQIIELLKKDFELNLVIDPNKSALSPGLFIKFNNIFEDNNIILDEDYIKNLTILLNLYKKDKDVVFIDISIFLTNYYLNSLKIENINSKKKIIEYKSFIFENINKFFLYNLNQNSLINVINSKITDE